MSEIERIEQAAGLHPARAVAPVRRAPRKRLSRAWFDTAILAIVGVSLAAAWMLRIWPVGCADDDVKMRVADGVRQQATGATDVSLHLISKISRASGELHCKAFSRIEFADRPYEHRDVDYVVRTNQAGGVIDVGVSLKPAER